jgi:hypothetical protein
MPPRKSYRRKPRRKTYKRKSALGKPSRGIKQSVYLFKRRLVEVVELNSQLPEEGWSSGAYNSLYKQLQYSLDDIRDSTDFSNLFSMYKLTAVKVQFMFSQTQSGPIPSGATLPISSNTNAQVIVMYAPWSAGNSEATDANYMKDKQSSKRRLGLNGGKPISMYMPLRQLSVRHSTATGGGVDFASVKPQWISTSEPKCVHYGSSVCFQRADRSIFAHEATQYQSCRIETTYYIACKGVQ